MAHKPKNNLDAVVEKMLRKKKRKDRGAGTRKYTRNRSKCQRYRSEGRREKNKARRAAKRLRNFR